MSRVDLTIKVEKLRNFLLYYLYCKPNMIGKVFIFFLKVDEKFNRKMKIQVD